MAIQLDFLDRPKMGGSLKLGDLSPHPLSLSLLRLSNPLAPPPRSQLWELPARCRTHALARTRQQCEQCIDRAMLAVANLSDLKAFPLLGNRAPQLILYGTKKIIKNLEKCDLNLQKSEYIGYTELKGYRLTICFKTAIFSSVGQYTDKTLNIP